MSEANYPRDLAGYEGRPPHPQWPGNARVAVQFALHLVEGGERSVLHGDPGSEPLVPDLGRPRSVPDARQPTAESVYEYGPRAGFWRLHRLFTTAGVPVTVFGVAVALARNPALVAAMKDAEWEIASHGLRWVDYQSAPEEVEREHVAEAIALHIQATGERPTGWYAGRPSPRTRDIVMDEGGFTYDSDSYADDLPYWVEGPHGPHLVVPYSLDSTDLRFAAPDGPANGEQFFAHLRDTFDVLYAEGSREPKLMSIGLHGHIAGRPGRFAAVQRFVEHVRSHDRVWWCRRIDIARHWHDHFRPDTARRNRG